MKLDETLRPARFAQKGYKLKRSNAVFVVNSLILIAGNPRIIYGGDMNTDPRLKFSGGH